MQTLYLINGRQILTKGKVAVKEAKKLLAFWMEYLINGKMPSGKNEHDALKYVIRRAREDTSVEVIDDDEDDADDGGNTQEENVKDNLEEEDAVNELADADNEDDDATFKDEDKEDIPEFLDSEEDEESQAKGKPAKKSPTIESTFLPHLYFYSFYMDPMELLHMDLIYLLPYLWILPVLMSKRLLRRT